MGSTSSFFNGSYNPRDWEWNSTLQNIGTGINNFLTLDPNVRVTNDGKRITTGATGYEDASNTFTFGDLLTPIGTGDNAQSILQLGTTILGLNQQKNQFDKQYKQALQNYLWSKNVTKGNALLQANNVAAQLNHQANGISGFYASNPEIAQKYLNNTSASLNTMNKALEMLEISNGLSEHISNLNNIAGYINKKNTTV